MLILRKSLLKFHRSLKRENKCRKKLRSFPNWRTYKFWAPVTTLKMLLFPNHLLILLRWKERVRFLNRIKTKKARVFTRTRAAERMWDPLWGSKGTEKSLLPLSMFEYHWCLFTLLLVLFLCYSFNNANKTMFVIFYPHFDWWEMFSERCKYFIFLNLNFVKNIVSLDSSLLNDPPEIQYV